jgi:1,4-alpha-glucan branching enzyme
MSALLDELGRSYNGDTYQRIVYSDSHDTAANGSARLNQVIAPDDPDGFFARKQSILAASILLTVPGIPMLFQGQEFMENGAFNDWEGLDWEKAERNQLVVSAYRHLIALRKNQDNNSAGLLGRNISPMHIDKDNKVLAYHRWLNGGAGDDVVVLINLADTLHEQYELVMPHDGAWKVRFSARPAHKQLTAEPDDVQVVDGRTTICLPPSSVLILSQDV